MELKFEVHELSCFDLVSKQLNLLAYIGRTSKNSRINGIEQQFKRIEEFKISANYLQWRSELARSWSESCLASLQLLAGEEWKGLEAMDSRRIEFQSSGDSSSNSNEFIRVILLEWRVFNGDSKLAQCVCDFWANAAIFIAETIDICTLEITFQIWSLMMHGCMGTHRPIKSLR